VPTVAPLLSTRERWVLGAVAAGGLAVLPLDRPIAQELREAHVQGVDGVRGAADALNLLGGPGLAMLGVGSYAVGRATGSPALTTLGVHTTTAVVAATAVAGVVKGVAGRQRPYVDAGDPDLFGAGRGFSRSSRTSFPSGHTTAAFALAAAATEETRHLWPDHVRLVGSLAYGTAGAVGLARVYDGKHWPSDVVVGAGLGTLTGLVTSRYLWRHPHNRLDRWLSGAAVTPSPGGDGIALAVRVR
jgi:membrane-associated phospholipid phosphatase